MTSESSCKNDESYFNNFPFSTVLIFLFIFISLYYLATGKVTGTNRNILIVIVFCTIIYMFYNVNVFNTSTDLVTTITDANVHSTITSDNLNTYQNNYSITGWFYIDDWNYKYGEPKVLLYRPDEKGGIASYNPLIYFNSVENNISVAVNCYSSDAATPETSKQFICKINNINLQKWVHLGVVLNNRTLDIYINGKLTKTCMLPGVPKINNESNIEVTPGNDSADLNSNAGFSGYVSKIVFFPNDLTPQQVYDEYRKGFGGNIFSSYDIKLIFFKDGQETNEFNLF
tara:strand:- start:1664 stop:2521 length:858 start_codon:yes stop_codon:yes gene_type:complete